MSLAEFRWGHYLRDMVNPIAAMGLMLVAFGGLTTALNVFRRRRKPHPEVVRKLFHVGMGLAALSLPWLFARAWPVIVLTAVFVTLLILLRKVGVLRAHIGSLLLGVERESLGEIYFAAGVGALFLFSRGDPLLFCIPMLILTFADAAAGVVGLYYGRLRIAVVAGEKSFEGSAAFFIAAFLSTHTVLLLFAETGRAETLLIALTVGSSLTLLEALAGGGIDNLLIPLVALLLLKAYLNMDVQALAAQLGSSLVLTTATMLWLRRRFCRRAGSDSSALRPSRTPAHSIGGVR